MKTHFAESARLDWGQIANALIEGSAQAVVRFRVEDVSLAEAQVFGLHPGWILAKKKARVHGAWGA